MSQPGDHWHDFIGEIGAASRGNLPSPVVKMRLLGITNPLEDIALKKSLGLFLACIFQLAA